MEGRNPRKLDRLWQGPSREHKVDVLMRKLLVHNVASMKPKAPKWAIPVVLLARGRAARTTDFLAGPDRRARTQGTGRVH